MCNKFKVKKKLVSITLALVLAAQPLCSFPMNVFAGTGKTDIIVAPEGVKTVQIKNKPTTNLLILTPGAIISGAGKEEEEPKENEAPEDHPLGPDEAQLEEPKEQTLKEEPKEYEYEEEEEEEEPVFVDAPELIVDASKEAQHSIKWEIVSGNKDGIATIDPKTGQIKIDPSKYKKTESNDITLKIKVTVGSKSDSYDICIKFLDTQEEVYEHAISDVKQALNAAEEAKKSVVDPTLELMKTAIGFEFEKVASRQTKNSNLFGRAMYGEELKEEEEEKEEEKKEEGVAISIEEEGEIPIRGGGDRPGDVTEPSPLLPDSYHEAFTFILNKALKNRENIDYIRAARIALASENAIRCGYKLQLLREMGLLKDSSKSNQPNMLQKPLVAGGALREIHGSLAAYGFCEYVNTVLDQNGNANINAAILSHIRSHWRQTHMR